MAGRIRFGADEELHNADWLRGVEWTLPPYKSPAFMQMLRAAKLTLAEFRETPIYRRAVERGLIVADEWAGPRRR